MGRLVEDGRVEGRVLTPSCESTRITTNCWTVIDRETLEHNKKDTPHPKQTRSHDETVGGAQSHKIKSHNHWVGDSQTGEQLYHRSPPTGVKVLSRMSGFPTWGSSNGRRDSQRIRLWSQAGFDCRTSTGLGETETPHVEGTHKVVCTSGPGGRSSDPTGDWTRPTC